MSEGDSGREWLLKETERERTIRKKGRADVNGDVNGVASPVKGKREENRDKCEDDGGENEREIRRLDNERESEKTRGGGGAERGGKRKKRKRKKRKVGYWGVEKIRNCKNIRRFFDACHCMARHRRRYFTLVFPFIFEPRASILFLTRELGVFQR